MPAKKIMTAAEFANTGPETDGYELVRGELVPVPRMTMRGGKVCGNVVFLLTTYKKKRGSGGLVCNDTGIITETAPDTVRGVDVAYFAKPAEREGQPDRYINEPPDLAVEVRSEGQAWKQLLAKSHEYIQMGARMVWIVDPAVSRLTVFQPEHEPAIYATENEFDGDDVLPGLHFKVAELFE
jgi:Uma2 family endonuclease